MDTIIIIRGTVGGLLDQHYTTKCLMMANGKKNTLTSFSIRLSRDTQECLCANVSKLNLKAKVTRLYSRYNLKAELYSIIKLYMYYVIGLKTREQRFLTLF